MLSVDVDVVDLPALLASLFLGRSVNSHVILKHSRFVYCREETSGKHVEQTGLPTCTIAE